MELKFAPGTIVGIDHEPHHPEPYKLVLCEPLGGIVKIPMSGAMLRLLRVSISVALSPLAEEAKAS